MRPLARPTVADLLTLRTTVILVVACVIGVIDGALTYLALRSLPQSLLAAGTATGGSARLLAQIIGADSKCLVSDHGDEDDGVGQ